jgi:hypothetical protein
MCSRGHPNVVERTRVTPAPRFYLTPTNSHLFQLLLADADARWI